MTPTKPTTETRVAVQVGYEPVYWTDSVGSAITSLPEKHSLALIFQPGTYDANLPDLQLLARNPAKYGIPARGNLGVGDAVEVLHRGDPQDSGGGRYIIFRRKTMTVVKLIGQPVLRSGDAEDSDDFVPAGAAQFAILADI